MAFRAWAAFFAAGLLLGAEPRAAEPPVLTDLKQAERAIERSFSDITSPNAMGLIGTARGAYLEGYGAVFTLQVMLTPIPGFGPFRPSYSEEELTKLNVRKRQRLEDLEAKVRDILVSEGSRLESVPAEEKVAVVVSLFHFPWEDLTGLPAQLVVQATRQKLIDQRAGRLDKQAFREHLNTRYF